MVYTRNINQRSTRFGYKSMEYRNIAHELCLVDVSHTKTNRCAHENSIKKTSLISRPTVKDPAKVFYTWPTRVCGRVKLEVDNWYRAGAFG